MATDADDLGFELIPLDDEEREPAAALDAAAASALGDLPGVEEEADEPLGYSWKFSWEDGRFVRHGMSPARVFGLDALKERCLMAVNAVRYAHPVFSDDFGIEKPLAGLGTTGREAKEAADDWRVKARDALMALEDVDDVSVDAEFDPLAGVIYLRDLVVTTNEDVELPFDDIRIDLDPEG